MTQTKKQRTQETLIIGHHLKGHHFFGKKDYIWRIRHYKTAGKKFLKIGQLAWVNITNQKRPAPVIITNIKTVTDPADCQQARRHQTVKKIVIARRTYQGRSALTSFIIVDAQSVKNTATGENKGYDAGKKISGIKRHLATGFQDI